MTLDEFLPMLEDVHGGGDQYSAKCPAHDDHKASLSITRRNDGGAIVNCHAGCTAEQITAALGLTVHDLYNTTAEHVFGSIKHEVAVYPYIDRKGRKSEKVRYSDKSFVWRQEDGKGGYIWGRKGVEPSLYMTGYGSLPELVYLVEGEKDANNATKECLCAVSPPDGASGKWHPQFTESLRGKRVCIIQDNDVPGRAFARRAAKALIGSAQSVKVLDLCKIWPQLPEHGDTSDLLSHMGSKEGAQAVAQLADTTPEFDPNTPDEQERPKLQIVRMADIDAKRAEYLLFPYLPKGKLSIMAGISGSTKTWLILDWAAIISRGREFITDNEITPPREPGVVIYQTKENDYETDVRPRLDKLEADLQNIIMIDDHDTDGQGFPLSLTDGRIEEAAKIYHPKLIIFDPIQSFLGEDIDMHRANEVRPVLDKLIDIAKRSDCAIVLISHMSKDTMKGALDRILGSSDFRNAARSIMVVGSDPTAENYPHTRVLAHAKNSLGRTGQSIKYHISEYEGVVYDGFCDLAEDEIVKAPVSQEHTRNKPAVTLTNAMKQLEELISIDGAAALEQVETLQTIAGISQRTMYNAKKELALQTVSIGQPPHRKTWWLSSDVDKEKFKEEHTPPPDQLKMANAPP